MLLVRSCLFAFLFYLWSVFWVLLILPLIVGARSGMVRSWRVGSKGVMLLLRLVCGIRAEFRGQLYMP